MLAYPTRPEGTNWGIRIDTRCIVRRNIGSKKNSDELSISTDLSNVGEVKIGDAKFLLQTHRRV
jgi:hypothetical protein